MDYYSKLQSRLPSSSSFSSSAYFPPHKTQLHPRMHYSPSPSPTKPSSQSRLDSHQRWCIVAVAVLILPFLFYLFAAARKTHLSSRFGAPSPKGYAVVIDARPSWSRVHVFEYLNEGRIPFVGSDGKGSVSLKVRPGLRAFVDDPEGAGKSLLELLDLARRTVPRAEWGMTKVRLMETGGGLGGILPDVRRSILKSCRRVLRSSGFLFRDEWVSTVTGQERGVYAWVAANYALGKLGSDPQETTGIVEFDGASTQIAFVSSDPPPRKYSHVLKLHGVIYNLYTSRMHWANQEGAWEFLDIMHNPKTITASSRPIEVSMMNPCIPKGYSQTHSIDIPSSASDPKLFVDKWGNFSACRSKALELIKQGQGNCPHPPCVFSKFLPELHGKHPPAENLFYISELFGLVPKASLLDLEAAGRRYCQDDWAKLREEHLGIDEADLLKYCFSSAYIVALLHDSLGVPMDRKSIGLMNQAGSAPLDWTLGAFIMHTMVEPELELGNLDHIAGDDSVTYVTLFAILFFVILVIFFVLRWQRPQFKMIYDLEKGHYIVTRMPR